MRKSRKSNKLAIAAVTALFLTVGGAAFAYWTLAGGTGTGTGATGVQDGAITVNQSAVISDLRPGGAAQTLNGTFTNSGTGPSYVTNVTVSIASVVKAVGAPAGACTSADYTLTGTTMAVGQQIQPGAANGTWTGATIAFNNTGVNQDGCQGATVNFSYVTT